MNLLPEPGFEPTTLGYKSNALSIRPTSYDIADYIQALRNIIATAAPMVRQQSFLIITPEWEYSS